MRNCDFAPGSEQTDIRIFRDSSHSYVVLPCSEAAEGYQYRMLAANSIPGLLACSGRKIDGLEYLYYDVTAGKSLEAIISDSFSGAELDNLLRDLIRVNRTLKEYLLGQSGVLLDPRLIFRAENSGAWQFIYHPDKSASAYSDMTLHNLAEYLAMHVDPGDRRAAEISCRLCTLTDDTAYILSEDLLASSTLSDCEEPSDIASHISSQNQKNADCAASNDGIFFPEREEWQRTDLCQRPEAGTGGEQQAKTGRGGRQGNVERHVEHQKAENRTEEKTYYRSGCFCITLSAAFLWARRVLTIRNTEKIVCEAGAIVMFSLGIFCLIRGLILRRGKNES